jgi:uncharacterized protein
MQQPAAAGRIIIPGGSGFLGQSLARTLIQRGYDVCVLTRNAAGWRGPGAALEWDGRTLGPWTRQLDGALAVVNFTGRSVNCRYTPENRREMIESRVDSVRVVDRAIAECDRPPRVLVQSGSLAIYGDAGDRLCDETAPPGDGFPVETCLRWESAFNEGNTPDTRRVLLRIGFVLGREGGALAVLARLTRCFLGGTVGSGRQYISWLHHADMARIVLRAIEHDEMSGVYNATGPTPVTNREFMRVLRRALHRPWSPPAPEWAVRIGSWLMGTEPSLALTGRRCIPRRLIEEGFEFRFTDLEAALEDVFRSE